MHTIKCTIQYDGANFSGFQIQPDKRTIQGELERALTKLHKGKAIEVHASGRTDRGVHAVGQVIHFQSPNDLAPRNWKQALNTYVPDDVYVTTVEKMPAHFHSRYHAVEKEYRYKVYQGKEYDVFKQLYTHYVPYPLDLAKIEEACTYLQGEHDFTTFSSARDTTKGSKVRTLTDVSCRQEGDELVFAFRGDGYLYNMVRIMIGTLLDVGRGKRDPASIPALFAAKDRQLAGATAPAEGLYLWEVTY